MRQELFLEAIAEDPDDDGPRLVYADWLEEHGDAEWAEFIRLQLALDPLPWFDVRHFCANLRLQQILESRPEHRDDDLPAWARKVCETARYQSYRRGMPSVIHCDAADWLAHGQELLERYPIDSVHFSWYTLLGLRDWLASPLTGQVRRYELSGQYLSDEDLQHIASSPALACVEALDLAHNSFGDAGAMALAESPYLENLRELDLSVTQLGPAGFRAVTQSRCLPKLRSLKVGHNHSTVGDAEMRELADSPHRFEKFVAYGTAITDKGVEALCEADCVSGLKYLDLGGNTLTGAAGEALANSPRLRDLEVLHLWNAQLGDTGAAAVGRSPYLGRLRYLGLLRCGIGPEGGRALGRTQTLRSLIELDLSHNACGDEPLAATAGNDAFRHLLDLHLKAAAVTSAGVSALAGSSCVNHLIRLQLADNQIDDGGAVAIARAEGCKDLRLLILHANRITDDGAKALAASRFRQMRVLQLGHNRIGDPGALAFLGALPGDCNLVLHGNPISDETWGKLERAMGDRFLLYYPDDLLSIPQRTPNLHTQRTGG